MDKVRKHKPRLVEGADQGREAAAGVKRRRLNIQQVVLMMCAPCCGADGSSASCTNVYPPGTPQGLWILDQHIVHERILVDKFRRAWSSRISRCRSRPCTSSLPSEASWAEFGALAEFGVELNLGGSSHLRECAQLPPTALEAGRKRFWRSRRTPGKPRAARKKP